MLTSVLVGDNLSLIVDSVGDGAVGVAKGQANDGPVLRRNRLGTAHFDCNWRYLRRKGGFLRPKRGDDVS